MKSIHKKTNIPGPMSQELRRREDQYLAPGLQRFAQLSGLVLESALGSYVRDVDGNVFLDLIGGIGVNGLGHAHPHWVQSLHKQIELLSVGSFTSLPRIKLLEYLSKHSPTSSLNQVQLYSSGAEAVESALRLAKSFTGKFEIISFWGGFHGKTFGALSLLGGELKSQMGPLAPGSHCIPYAYCYRCPLKLKYPSCGLACVEVGRQFLKTNSSQNIAAFIIEPMQGAGGNIIPPPEFLKAIEELAREQKALLIADEMITGFGRTGTYWGIEHSQIQPDLITVGKQMGGGFPISGIIGRADRVQAQPWSQPSGSSSSYGGSPLASAAALAALEVIDQEKLVSRSQELGKYFLDQLKPMEDQFPFVGEVRGSGLFLAFELVKDKRTKEPLSKKVSQHLFFDLLNRGLLTLSYDARFRIQPAMTIKKEEIDEAVQQILESFHVLAQSKKWAD